MVSTGSSYPDCAATARMLSLPAKRGGQCRASYFESKQSMWWHVPETIAGENVHIRRSCSYLHNDVGQGPLARERVQKGASFFLKNTSKKVILVKNISPRRKKPQERRLSPFAGAQQADNGRLPPTSPPRNSVTCGLHPSRPHLL